MHALLSDDPLRSMQRAAGETFAAARGVAQRDGIGGGIEADLVRSGIAPARLELTSIGRS